MKPVNPFTHAPLVYVRFPSQAPCGYRDMLGEVSEFITEDIVNVVDAAGRAIANGQSRCKTMNDFGWFVPGDPQWMTGLNPL